MVCALLFHEIILSSLSAEIIASVADCVIERNLASDSRRAISIRFCSVISHAIVEAPIILPVASLIGEMVKEEQIFLQSLLIRMVSWCSMRCPCLILSRSWGNSSG